jgi:hypothetical protein
VTVPSAPSPPGGPLERATTPEVVRGGSLSPEQLAAAVAAIEMAWPRPVVVEEEEPPTGGVWRFSGRWWSGPHTVQRRRPWIAR